MDLRFRRTLGLASALLVLTSALAQTAPVPSKLPTLFFVGDVSAETLGKVFDSAHLNIASSAAAGRTTRTYLNSGDWEKLLAQVKPGDFILIEFPPDALSSAGQSAATRTLQGAGDATFDYLDPGTQKLELVHSYGWYLRRMVVDAINHGASPILCAPPAATQTAAISPDAAEPADAQSTPAAWSRAIATEQRVPWIDLTTSGATVTAETLRTGIQSLQPDPLAPYLQRQKP